MPQRLWFQQDASAHYSQNVQIFLDKNYQSLDRTGKISFVGLMSWDYQISILLITIYVNYVKDAVYQEAPTTRLDMIESEELVK